MIVLVDFLSYVSSFLLKIIFWVFIRLEIIKRFINFHFHCLSIQYKVTASFWLFLLNESVSSIDCIENWKIVSFNGESEIIIVVRIRLNFTGEKTLINILRNLITFRVELHTAVVVIGLNHFIQRDR